MAMLLLTGMVKLILVEGNDGPPECRFNQRKCKGLEKASRLGHMILVHGSGHGDWYKLKPLLEAAGYEVTTVQLGPTLTTSLDSTENITFLNYSKPLFDVMKCVDHHKVILVAYSFGGLSISLAMEKFPKKFMKVPKVWKDSCSITRGNNSWISFGDKFLKSSFYQLCSPEDFALISTLKRPGSFFPEDLDKIQLSEKKYGSVNRVYIIAKDDLAIREDFQREMIANYTVKEVKVIDYSGHEPHLSRPLELSAHLLEVARNYSSSSRCHCS
ncbi:salicylic acid-binding protein 2-like [Macadamia integrifolia]|uniref:salicylic acid-binding protein 2-like n=1 Tax=Macadamia integrifolia TaxID=60698 RepID=UPI001C52A8EE|nr:salicylic acid-binding protein 2-like [Macadamia integrifolia]